MSQWTCPKCSEIHDSQFETCWKCAGPNPDPALPPPPPTSQLDCLRCKTNLTFAGTRNFRDAPSLIPLGGFAEWFAIHHHFDIYVCPRCGKVEFYVDGIGEEWRKP